jgi:branched-chain amino acid transport system ATP-binding protein
MGLSPILVRQIFATIADIHRDGTTILLVEQNARLALSIADQAYVLEGGQVVLQGAPAALVSDERVKAAYLGGG